MVRCCLAFAPLPFFSWRLTGRRLFYTLWFRRRVFKETHNNRADRPDNCCGYWLTYRRTINNRPEPRKERDQSASLADVTPPKFVANNSALLFMPMALFALGKLKDALRRTRQYALILLKIFWAGERSTVIFFNHRLDELDAQQSFFWTKQWADFFRDLFLFEIVHLICFGR